ncbi:MULTISPECIES: DUF4198 domain-containing protein [Vitreoscilla]|uniref:DUF4198 domain-containing protein n=1 Tax=Vitreoscilla stercoraria TaxID=61 RepID=A0ABY4E8R4_VITST|nr:MULTISPECIES: DUF4198 domain-containing protein [Vitreoscilla]AUZ04481.1 hypothetical protein ADP71_07220 [Vitreoscilla sp. C1]UOO91805.1 DUF4198 domain-containing protein [Vitreoscilla stercoraria]
MKKTAVWVVLGLVAAQAASAHEMWAAAKHTHGGEMLQAAIGYGHFPKQEPIVAERLAIFKAMELVGREGKQTLKQQGKNYQYVSKKPLKEGSYLLLATYQPTFWSENQQGWKQQSLLQMRDAHYCEQSAMYGKAVLNIGHGVTDNAVISRPVGQMLEIVPLLNPAKVHVGEKMPVQVLFKGEPLAGATLVATFDGFSPRDSNDKSHALGAQAFSDQTDAQGITHIIPLREGHWKAKVVHKADYANLSECQKLAAYATLTFEIGSAH